MSDLKKTLKVAVLTGLAATVLGACERVTDREVAIKTKFGKVVETDIDSGLKCVVTCLGYNYPSFPSTLDSARIQADEDSSTTIRTNDGARVLGDVIIKFRIDKERAVQNGADIGQLYSFFKNEYHDDIADYALLATQKVYPTYSSFDVTGKSVEIGEKVRDELQAMLDKQGYQYFKVEQVVTSGMGLSPKANEQLEQIVSVQREEEIADTRLKIADKVLEAEVKQAEITGAAFEKLREAGVPEEDLLEAYCLQLQRDSGKLGNPNVAGCIKGTSPYGGAMPK